MIYTTYCILLSSDKFRKRTGEINEQRRTRKATVRIANDFKQRNQKFYSGVYNLTLTLKTKTKKVK